MPSIDNRYIDGDLGFGLAMDSATDPETLVPSRYVRSFNAVNRGGFLQCRPGYKQLMNLPEGQLQGGCLFTPTSGAAQLVFAVDGNIYVSFAPFKEFHQIAGIQFSAIARFVHFAPATQSVIRNADLSLTLIDPVRMLIIQDGLSAPAYWNGAKAAPILDADSTPVGTVMKWSGERLWVARGNRLFASDYANPLSFFEGLYIGNVGIGAFLFPEDITAMAELTSTASPLLLVFTRETTTAVQSNIRQRTAWETTAGFLQVWFPNTGCVGHNALTDFNGQLWWFSAEGLANLNSAEQRRVSSQFNFLDTPMVYSKRLLSANLAGVAMGSFENYLLISVPYASLWNHHTWVYDSAVAQANRDEAGGWQGHWTGTRPVIWLCGTVNEDPWVIQLSVDRDGKNRVWRAFETSRLDNGCPIVWGFETRGYIHEQKLRSWLRYADFYFSEMQGDVDIKVLWAGVNRGLYKPIALRETTGMRGSFDHEIPVNFQTKIFALRKQARVFRTEEIRRQDPTQLDSCGVEDKRSENFDVGFQFWVVVAGPAACRGIKVYAQPEPEKRTGDACEAEEDPFRGVRFDGGAVKEPTKLEAIQALMVPSIVYIANAVATFTYRGVTAVGSGVGADSISQASAQRIAMDVAEMRAAHTLMVTAPGYLGGGNTCAPGGVSSPFIVNTL